MGISRPSNSTDEHPSQDESYTYNGIEGRHPEIGPLNEEDLLGLVKGSLGRPSSLFYRES